MYMWYLIFENRKIKCRKPVLSVKSRKFGDAKVRRFTVFHALCSCLMNGGVWSTGAAPGTADLGPIKTNQPLVNSDLRGTL